jgi:hypothetical protein
MRSLSCDVKVLVSEVGTSEHVQCADLFASSKTPDQDGVRSSTDDTCEENREHAGPLHKD